MNTSYKECCMFFEDNKDNFRELQQALPDVSNSIRKFEQKLAIDQNTLNHQILLYHDKMRSKFQQTQAMEIEGYLWKKGSGITKSWQRRYFICKKHELAYYHTAADSNTPRGALPLLLTSVKPVQDPERRFCFTVISQGKTYLLQALSQWDMDEWIAVIGNNIQYLLDNNGNSDADNEIENSVPRPLVISQRCADCGIEHPTWCCINWGNAICIQCSGVHRSLTTTISKVRSLTLDRLEPLILDLMSTIGNDQVNKVLEENLPPDQKISPSATKEEREAFIIKKYKNKEFATKIKVDMKKAIKERNIADVFIGIANGQIQSEQYLLHQAAVVGDPLITLLIALNTIQVNDLLDGWSPLSLGAYYGNQEACEALLIAGVDPNCSSPQTHPYLMAKNQNHSDIETLFLSYWKGDTTPPPNTSITPPISK